MSKFMLPDRKKIKHELILLLEETGPLEVQQVYNRLAKRFNLTEHNLTKTTKDGENFFEKEVRWAKKDLVDNGTIKQPSVSGRGIWDLANLKSWKEDLSPLLYNSPDELEEILARISPTVNRPEGQAIPPRISVLSEVFGRDARVVAYILSEAAGICDVCRKSSPFTRDNDEPFLEVHHIKRLADGGSDTVQNAIAACPNCHRELHYGKNRDAIKRMLYLKIKRLIEE
jgi:5-methylcytosine-specific restriction protein A